MRNNQIDDPATSEDGDDNMRWIEWLGWGIGGLAAAATAAVGGLILWRWWRGYVSSYKFKFHEPDKPLDRSEILHNLKFMIGLEVEQVKMFRYQASKLRREKANDYLVALLDAAARFEHIHVRRLRTLYHQLFGRPAPSRLGHAAGWITIFMSAVLPQRWMATWDAWTEQLAIAHYERVSRQVSDPTVRRICLEHAADERAHRDLFQKWEILAR